MEREPDRSEYREALGNVYVRNKQYDEGLKEFQVIAAKKSTPEILIKMGEVYRLKGDVNNALDYFQKAKTAAGSASAVPSLRFAMLLDGMTAAKISSQLLRSPTLSTSAAPATVSQPEQRWPSPQAQALRRR